MRDDAQDLRRRIEDGIEGVLDSLAPGWRRRGNTAYLTPKSAKDLGSFTVSLRNGGRLPRGCFYRFSQHIGGGAVELVSYLRTGRKDDYAGAFQWTRQHFGLEHAEEDPAKREERERRDEDDRQRREHQSQQDAERAERVKAARVATAVDVWAEGEPLRGTHGDAYFVARGLPPVADWPWQPDEALRFHPALDYERDRKRARGPAIVARVQDPFGDTIAVWQIYLDPKKPQKATDVDNAKIGRGPATGGAVRLGGEAPRIGMGEGIETSLAAWVLERYRYPVWAGLSTSGVAGFEPPLFVKRISAFPDGDPGIIDKATKRILKEPGMAAVIALRDRVAPIGIKFDINDMPISGDALDLLNTMRDYEKRRSTT